MTRIDEALRRHAPQLIEADSMRRAAVAMILRDRGDDTEVMFIKRAEAENDPWSGQIAFPGGGHEASDPTLADAAIRETMEETAVAITHQQEIGRLDDLQGSSRSQAMNLMIACYVYRLDAAPVPVPNYEVAEVFWTPLSQLRDTSRQIHYQTRFRDEPYPAVHLGHGRDGADRILWGLTYRFVQGFLKIIAADSAGSG